MTNQRSEFVEAMRQMETLIQNHSSWLRRAEREIWKRELRRAVIAFADAYDDIPWNRPPNQARRRRAALLRECGLEERDGEA